MGGGVRASEGPEADVSGWTAGCALWRMVNGVVQTKAETNPPFVQRIVSGRVELLLDSSNKRGGNGGIHVVGGTY